MAQNQDDNLEKLVRLSHVVARPWKLCAVLLSILLAASLCVNAWIIIKGGPKIILDADDNIESDVVQTNNG